MTCYPNGLKTPPTITTDYMGYPGHNGTDSINHPDGNNHATDDGVVIMARYNGSAGNEVRIRHDAKSYISRELHASSFHVSEGDTVKEAQPVSVTGTTGESTGIHCHYELWKGGDINQREWPYRQLAALIALEAVASISEESEMKVFENVGGQGSPEAGIGAVYVGGPGVWYQVGKPGHQFVNDRAILQAVWGPIVGLHGLHGDDTKGDIGLIREACLAGMAVVTDAQIKAIIDGVAAKIPKVDLEALTTAVSEIEIPTAAQIAANVKVPEAVLSPAAQTNIITKVIAGISAKLPKKITTTSTMT